MKSITKKHFTTLSSIPEEHKQSVEKMLTIPNIGKCLAPQEHLSQMDNVKYTYYDYQSPYNIISSTAIGKIAHATILFYNANQSFDLSDYLQKYDPKANEQLDLLIAEAKKCQNEQERYAMTTDFMVNYLTNSKDLQDVLMNKKWFDIPIKWRD